MLDTVKDWIITNIGKAAVLLSTVVGSLSALAGYLAAAADLFGK